MPTGDVRINIGRIQQGKAEVRRTKNREIFEEMKELLGSIRKMRTSRPDRVLFGTMIKKFIYSVTSIRDDYFLSDICEQVHELFVEFRMALGHYDISKSGKSHDKKLQVSLEDVVEMSEDIFEQYREFMDASSGYVGTDFPKPRKLRSMRELNEVVRESEDVFVLHRTESKPLRLYSKTVPTKEFCAEVTLDDEVTQEITKIVSLNLPSAAADKSKTSEFVEEETPRAPNLYSEEVNTMKTLSRGLEESLLVAAMGDLMAPPPPPNSNHGRISYMNSSVNGGGGSIGSSINNSRRRHSGSSMIKAPVIVDEEGDIMPSNAPIPQLKSAAASIYESSGGRIVVEGVDERITTLEMYLEATGSQASTPKSRRLPKFLEDEDEDDSFIQAYRQSALSGKSSLRASNSGMERSNNSRQEQYSDSGWSQNLRY